jgi:hypothetical protein
MRKSKYFIMILSVCAALGWQSAHAQGYILSPDTVEEGIAFELSLLHSKYHCATEFTHLSVEISGRNINLSFLPVENPYVGVCSPDSPPVGPSFRMEALEAGVYAVHAIQLLPCMVSDPACMIAVIPEFAGNLTVTSGTEIQWSISPEKATANTPFTLQILNIEYNNCNYIFDNQYIQINGNEIILSYSTQMTRRWCLTSISPWGPAYEMEGLEAGRYQVYAMEYPACISDDPPCLAEMPEKQEVGILEIIGTSPSGWFLNPETVTANTPFTLNLLNDAYGSCEVLFSHLTASVNENDIYLSFVKTTDILMECFANITPYGPSFEMEGLAPGEYTVYAVDMPACAYADPQCPVRLAPEPIGVLAALHPASVNRETVFEMQAAVKLESGRIIINLPAGYADGIKVALYSISGKEVFSSRHIPAATGIIHIPILQNLKPGMYSARIYISGNRIHSNRIVLLEK